MQTLPSKIMEPSIFALQNHKTFILCPTQLWSNKDFAPKNHIAIVSGAQTTTKIILKLIFFFFLTFHRIGPTGLDFLSIINCFIVGQLCYSSFPAQTLFPCLLKFLLNCRWGKEVRRMALREVLRIVVCFGQLGVIKTGPMCSEALA